MNPVSLFEALAPDGWPALVLVTGRVLGVIFVAPVWSMSALPRNVRVAFAVVLTLALVPGTPAVAVGEDVLALPGPIAAEVAVGLAMGLTAAVLLYGAAVAGEVVSVQMGLAISATFQPFSDVNAPGLGSVKNLLVLGLYLALGGHLMLVSGLAESLIAIPPGHPLNLAEGWPAVVRLGSAVFVTGVQIAAPVMVALVLANVALAVLSKAVPQINTMMVAFPITIALGFLVFGAALPYIAGYIRDWVWTLSAGLRGTIDAFTPIPGS